MFCGWRARSTRCSHHAQRLAALDAQWLLRSLARWQGGSKARLGHALAWKCGVQYWHLGQCSTAFVALQAAARFQGGVRAQILGIMQRKQCKFAKYLIMILCT